MIIDPGRPFRCAATNAADHSLLRWRLSGPAISQDALIAFAPCARLANTQLQQRAPNPTRATVLSLLALANPVNLALQVLPMGCSVGFSRRGRRNRKARQPRSFALEVRCRTSSRFSRGLPPSRCQGRPVERESNTPGGALFYRAGNRRTLGRAYSTRWTSKHRHGAGEVTNAGLN